MDENTTRRIVDEQHNFAQLAKEAYDKPWWRELVKAVETRRLGFLNALVVGGGTDRDEYRLRGQINELTWFIQVDEQAGRLVAADKEKK